MFTVAKDERFAGWGRDGRVTSRRVWCLYRRNGCRACDGFILAMSPEIRSIGFVIHAFLASFFVVDIRSYSRQGPCQSVSVRACHTLHNRENHKSRWAPLFIARPRFGTLDSPEVVEVSRLRAVSRWLW